MAIRINHSKVSAVSDGANSAHVQPSDWNANLVTSMTTNRLVGRTTASTGPFEEISVGSGLYLSGGSLSANNNSQTYDAPTFTTSALFYLNDSGALVGPSLTLFRHSDTPAASDVMGGLFFSGRDSANNSTDYARIRSIIADPTNGSEDGELSFSIAVAGTMTDRFNVNADGTTFFPQVAVYSSDAGAGYGPTINLYRDSASPANDDGLGYIIFSGEDSGGNYAEYAHIRAKINDTTDGSEDGELAVWLNENGSMVERFTVGTASFGNQSYFKMSHGYGVIQYWSDGAEYGPDLWLTRRSDSPAASDGIGEVIFQGQDSGANSHDYAILRASIVDPTNASEDGQLAMAVSIAGTMTNMLVANSSGITIGGTAGNAARLDSENQPLTGGATVTSKSLGTQSSGTLTLDMGDRPLQHYTNGGAHTLAPGAVNGSCLVDITNNASAGAITTSGWTKVAGDSFTTTNGHKFRCHCSVGNGGSLLIVQALQ